MKVRWLCKKERNEVVLAVGVLLVVVVVIVSRKEWSCESLEKSAEAGYTKE